MGILCIVCGQNERVVQVTFIADRNGNECVTRRLELLMLKKKSGNVKDASFLCIICCVKLKELDVLLCLFTIYKCSSKHG